MAQRIRPFVDCITLADPEPGKPATSEIQILKTGEFSKADWFGDVDFTINASDLKAAKDNFDRYAKEFGTEIAVNFDHERREAAGWMKSFREDGKAGYVTVEWTEDAAADLRKKKYRYTSAEFDEHWKHPETGEKWGFTVLGAAITNYPFLRGMAPIALSDAAGSQIAKEKAMADEEKKAEPMMKKCPKCGTEVEFAESAEVIKLRAEMVGLRAKVPASGTIVLTAEEFSKFNDRLLTAEKATAEANARESKREAKAAVDAQANKIAPALREHAERLYLSDRPAFDAFVAALPAQKFDKAKGTGGDGAAAEIETLAAKDPRAAVFALADAKVKDGKAKDTIEALRLVRAERPDLYQSA